jgi:arabinogalactan endo-1,4-beta-galactosidase
MTVLRVLRWIVPFLLALALISGCNLLKVEPDDSDSQNPPLVYKNNPDFIKGSVIVDSFINRIWNGGTFEPLQTLKNNGLDWVRVGVTTQSFTELAGDVSTWPAVGYPEENDGFSDYGKYWSSREVAGQILKEASTVGCKLDVFLFLSYREAYAFFQNTPDAWSTFSDTDLAAQIKTSARETAQYFHQKLGFTIEVYEIGNEIDFGILNRVAGKEITVPDGVDMVNQRGWLEDNIWSLEVPFLKAAIEGIDSYYADEKIIAPKI